VAPNIYFLGLSGVVKFGSLRLGGLSGIAKDGDYRRPYARPPYAQPSGLKAAYHVRELDVWKLAHLAPGSLDIFLSHDWPRGVWRHGDAAALARAKPFLASEMADGSLGSGPGAALLATLQPRFWFSAHLHTKFAALVPHAPPGVAGGATRFLALDKCLPRRAFLQLLELPDHSADGGFAFDPEWLSILRATHAAMPAWLAPSGGPPPPRLPWPPLGGDALAGHALEVGRALGARGGGALPTAFARTARAFEPAQPRRGCAPAGPPPPNPQTMHLLGLLGLPYLLDGGGRGDPGPPPRPGWAAFLPPQLYLGRGAVQQLPPLPPPPAAAAAALRNPEELELPDGEEVEAVNPEEVVLPEEEEER